MKPVVLDLYCGLGGWSEQFIAAGYQAIGFDIEAHDYGSGGYPGELVIADVRALRGADLVKAYGIPACIVASPPCQEFSYMAMPWSKAKAKLKAIAADPKEQERLTDLFRQCFRIQREVSDASGRYIPIVIENVRGAQRWVGKARWNFGSFYLWGDVPALMPIRVAEGLKLPGNNSPDRWEDRKIQRLKDAGFKAAEGIKLPGNNAPRLWSEREVQRLRDAGTKARDADGCDYSNRDFGWKAPRTTFKSPKRKEASALIAKIPPPLAAWIARVFKPVNNA